MKQKGNNRLKAHLLMALLVCIWGFDYVPAKFALGIMAPMCLLFTKYVMGLVVMIILKVCQRNWNLIRKKDLPIVVLCSLFGEILYFNCEYNAMDYMQVSLITIILAFVPAAAVLIEWAVYRRKPTVKLMIGILICIFGVMLTIGVDFSTLLEGRLIGYILCFVAVLAWNLYNFITASLEKYDAVTLTCTQMLCTMLLIAPVAIHHYPSFVEFTPQIVWGLLWLGIIDAGFGFLIVVYALKTLGPATESIYSDFMPVTATFFSFLFLHESIGMIQILGGIIVIASGFVVIQEKGKLDSMKNATE